MDKSAGITLVNAELGSYFIATGIKTLTVGGVGVGGNLLITLPDDDNITSVVHTCRADDLLAAGKGVGQGFTALGDTVTVIPLEKNAVRIAGPVAFPHNNEFTGGIHGQIWPRLVTGGECVDLKLGVQRSSG